MSEPCPLCGAPPHHRDQYDHWTCGTQTGAKGHPSLYSRGDRCKRQAATPPDNHEAVEAAIKVADGVCLPRETCINILSVTGYWHTGNERYAAAALILADEVERLRSALDKERDRSAAELNCLQRAHQMEIALMEGRVREATVGK